MAMVRRFFFFLLYFALRTSEGQEQNLGSSSSSAAWKPSHASCLPPWIHNSNVSFDLKSSRIDFPSGTSLTVTCDRGFRLLDPNSNRIECRDGVWTSAGFGGDVETTTMTSAILPQCLVWCQRPVIANGDVTNSASEFPPGTQLKMLCNEGYRLSNQYVDTVECAPTDGRWIFNDRLLPECVLPTCPQLQIPPNAIVQYRGKTGEDRSFLEGSRVSFACEQGFKLSLGISVERDFECRNGSWQDLPPVTCEVIGCGPPLLIRNGEAVLDSSSKFVWSPGEERNPYPVGSKVTYRCQDGFSLVGFSSRYRCSAKGRWVPSRLPTCKVVDQEVVPKEAVRCPPPPLVLFARLENATVGPFLSNSAVFYVCDDGFQLEGLPSLVCNADGEWQPQPGPTCRPNIILPDDCLKPPPPTKTFGGPLDIAGANRQMMSLVVATVVSALLLTILIAVQLTKKGGWKYLSAWTSSRMPPVCRQPVAGGGGGSGSGVGGSAMDNGGSVLGFPARRDNLSSLGCCEPDRVALLNGQQVRPPSYEEAIQQSGPPPSDLFYSCIFPNPHRNRYRFVSLRSNGRDGSHEHLNSAAPTRHSSSSTSHSACGRSSSMADSLNSTDTAAPSEVSTTVTVETLSSTTSHPTSTTSTRAFCGSLASFDTAESDSALNLEGVPLLEETECDQGVSPTLQGGRSTLDLT